MRRGKAETPLKRGFPPSPAPPPSFRKRSIGRVTFEKGETQSGGQRPPAKRERKNRAFSAKRQAVWFESEAFQTEKALLWMERRLSTRPFHEAELRPQEIFRGRTADEGREEVRTLPVRTRWPGRALFFRKQADNAGRKRRFLKKRECPSFLIEDASLPFRGKTFFRRFHHASGRLRRKLHTPGARHA